MSQIPIPMLKNNRIGHMSNMDVWDNLREFHNHHSSMVAHHVYAPLRPVVEWNETPEAHVLRVELPGLMKEEVKVEVKEGKLLKVSGIKKREREEKHDNWHRVERSEGQFMKVFTLPDNARADRVMSHFENSLLTVTLPKLDAYYKSHVKKKNAQVMAYHE